MYENWRLERWQTVMSNANHLFLESLLDNAAGLQLDFADCSNDITTARYRVTFTNYPAYRNFDEMYRIKLWERRPPDATGWTLIVPESPWIREFADEPILEAFNPGLVHYIFTTENDVVEVLSNQAPTIERLD